MVSQLSPGRRRSGSAGVGAATRASTAALALVLVACGGGQRGAEPAPPPPPPDLRGERVMLLPARAPAPGQLDAELAYWLGELSPATQWVLPETLQAAADRAPAWRLRLEALRRPFSDMGAGDRRVLDPLYGALRQLGAVVDANYAVVPIQVDEVTDSAGTRVLMAVAVVDIRGGRILWMHTVDGGGNPERRGAVASVAETVARSLFP